MARGVLNNPVECRRCHEMTGYPKIQLCLSCRNIVSPNASQKYFWTPEQDAALRDVYAQFGKRQVTRGLGSAAAKATGMPVSIASQRAQRLGLTHDTRHMWTDDEVAFLKEHAGQMSVKAIAKKLKRGYDNVTSKLERLRISRKRTEGYTAEQLAELMGVSKVMPRRWEAKGYIWRSQGTYLDSTVVKFLESHPEEYDLARVEQFWFKSLIFPGAQCFNLIGQGGRMAPRSVDFDDEFEDVQTSA